MTASTAERNKKHNDAGLIPPDWKSYVGKTLVTMALTGLGSLMFLSARFLLNEVPREQEMVTRGTVTINQESAQPKRLRELSISVKETTQRKLERSARIN